MWRRNFNCRTNGTTIYMLCHLGGKLNLILLIDWSFSYLLAILASFLIPKQVNNSKLSNNNQPNSQSGLKLQPIQIRMQIQTKSLLWIALRSLPKPIKAKKKTIWKYEMEKYAGIEEHAVHLPAYVWQRVLEERHPWGVLF